MFDTEQLTLWLFIVDFAFVAMTLLHMLYQRRSPQSLATWLLAIILLPYIGVLFYFIFGLRKSYSKRYKAKITQKPITKVSKHSGLKYELDTLMNSNHISGTTENNVLQVIGDDIQAFELLMELINQAKEQISLETYIFEADDTGNKILDALTEKAKQGVEVRLLMDAIGSFRLYYNQIPLKALQKAGGHYAFFQPIWPNIITSQINLRNHRKIYLFDQQVVLTGGLNLSDDYLGENNGRIRWLDLFFKIEGPACYHYQSVFNADWLYTSKEKLPPAITGQQFKEGEAIQAVPSGPDIESDTLYEALLHAINSSKQRIYIATPYFIPNNNVMNALLIAIKRGVTVKVLTPSKSDHWLFDFGRSSYMRELVEAGGKAYFFPHNMLHAKLIIFDDQVAMSGSANMDYRSLFLNYEMVHFLYCQSTIKNLTKWFNENQKKGEIYRPKHSWLARFIENISRIIAPIL